MSMILRIDASSRLEGSQSRLLGDEVERRLIANSSPARVVRRDLARKPLEHIRAATIAIMFGQAKKRMFGRDPAIALSDEIIAEIKAAEAILITTPIYNFGLPSGLKAWIDQLVRINETFSYDGSNFAGLLAAKPVYVIIAYGAGGYVDGPMQSADFVKPYLDFVLRFIGLTRVTFITAEGTSGPGLEAGLSAARAQIAAAFAPHAKAA